MSTALILWGHALAALIFAAAALAAWRRPRRGRGVFVAALLVTALWALAMAGIDSRDLSTRLAESARNLAWLGFAWMLVRRARAGGWALGSIYLVVAVVLVAAAGLAIAEAATPVGATQEKLATARLLFRMMAAAGALVLMRQLHVAGTAAGTSSVTGAGQGHGHGQGHGAVQLIATALAIMWSLDLTMFAAAYARGFWSPALLAARGFVMAGVAVLLAAAAQRRDGWTLGLSRPATVRALAAVALVLYLGVVACLTQLAAAIGGDLARALQTGVVIGAAAALLAALSTSWLGAWAKVKLAKHLFRHRYDYRTEWQRFTDTLGGGGAPLEERVVTAVAALLDAPGGVLLGTDASTAAWRWHGSAAGTSEALAAHLLASGRIVELDAVRAGAASGDAAVVPGWMLDAPDAWALAPLIHGDVLVGMVLLARPPITRALDWEDFDLLRVAGRQAASHLAEDRAGRALAEAQRFDEFNRRFAFILHDIKNLVSQQQLVARNAERHAANPAFRADMIATLKDSADRMTVLLARLAQREPPPTEALGPVDVVALLERVAGGRRGQHAVECRAEQACRALAHPQRLEQALVQLVQNALEASGETSVTLSARGQGDRVAIEVADRGTGMSPVFVRDQLFRPFVSSKPGGFGIGAYEARQLIEAMGGSLGVDSREGEGTCFRVLLPAAPALEMAA